MHGRTHGRTDGHLRPTLLGRLGGVDLIIRYISKLVTCNWFAKLAAIQTYLNFSNYTDEQESLL